MAKKKFFIDKHNLIPKHTVLSDKDKKALLERYQISIREMPKIFKNDSAIRNLDVKVGDIIKIVRDELTSGKTVYYRGVING